MSTAESFEPSASLEGRRLVRVINLTATPNGDYKAYINDLQQETQLDIEHAPVIITERNPKNTRAKLWHELRPGDLIHAECSDGTIREDILPIMANPSAPSDLVLMTSLIGNAKNNHKAAVPKKYWLRPSDIIKYGRPATIYPLRTYIFQPESEQDDRAASVETELAVAIASIGGIATGAAALEAPLQRSRRSDLKRYAHRLFGSGAAELATLLYDTGVSLRSLKNIHDIEYAVHPHGLEASIAEAFVNARKVAKVARFKKADLLQPGFEYGTIGPGKLNQYLAMGRLMLGTMPTETIHPGVGHRLHFRLASHQAANMEHDGDPRRLRAGSSVDVDQVFWGDPTHRPIDVVVMRQAA